MHRIQFFQWSTWALENHNSGETVCSIHADNCGGQNKKQYVLGYFMWRVMTGQHSQIYYKVQVPGHSRTTSSFRLDSICQLVDVDNKSSTTSLRQYQHFSLRSDEPEVITLKKSSSGVETKINILRVPNHRFTCIKRPDVVRPSGLSESRRQYLFTSVRPYVRATHQDDTCP
ncbi:hypothetical protein KUTeg_009136 [Tegillarca granosa]|uniref:Uncharacterized protein n=1 Tax=Tegillarca granosa TaxID=220873 RepID=A0ABQ9FCH2_TEGGR|nr:hypothetical protein KUTeg_009136 [Tegillarca granosa]